MRGDLQDRPLSGLTANPVGALDANLRIDPSFQEPAIVFSNQVVFGTAYGEDFTRKAAAGVGILLGLNPANDLPASALLSLTGSYLNESINTANSALEPVFPSNVDVVHGNYIHRADSVDIDLYRFEVNLNDADKTGTLTAETYAERLPDSSLLDTTLTLFEEVSATATTDLGFGPELEIQIDSLVPGRLGNNARVDFIKTIRSGSDNAVRILPAVDGLGNVVQNGIIVELPLASANVTEVSAQDVVDAINNDRFASSIFRATVTVGDGSENVINSSLAFSPVLLSGGGIQQLSRNDDYFGEDSRLIASLDAGIYYVGVAASGNDHYDPTIPGSGEGGRTQGEYQLQLKFEPQVDETDVLRDLDSDRTGVPGAVFDGDGDGVPGGVHNFWFQTRPLNRMINFTADGLAVTAGQTLTVVGANNIERVYEFVPLGATPRPGNIAVSYNPGTNGFPTPAGNLTQTLQAAINSRTAETGVSVSRNDSSLEFTGERSIEFSTGFRGAEALGRNIFVDKVAGPFADGSLENPFNNIGDPTTPNAFGSTIPGDIVRIVGNGGLDGDLTTTQDNLSYRIGTADVGGGSLDDGRSMEVPQGVTTMIDAGAAFKLRNSFIGIGSSTVQVDRSGGALQVLGTPRLVQLSVEGDPIASTLVGGEDNEFPGYDDGAVIFTSIRDREVDAASSGTSANASQGDWGGLVYRRDIDLQEGRRDLEDDGVFLQRVNHAEIRYGGGSGVLIDSVQQTVNPVQIVNMRPTLTFNEIRFSADSAISAAPDSFEETSFQAPQFQQAGVFTADYDRVGPEIHNNQIVDNSINGLFIRATTTPTQTPQEFTTAARFDDIDVVHYVAENLKVAAAPGGSITDGFAPSMSLVSGAAIPGGDLGVGVVQYKLTFVDKDGFESMPSADTFTVNVAAANSSVQLSSLPRVEQGTDYVTRRLYRADGAGSTDFRLVAELDAGNPGFIDEGKVGDAILDLTRAGTRGRLDASLVADPGLVFKLRGTRIELGHGTQFLAEGLGSQPIVFASSQDDRFGAGGTFDTNNDDQIVSDLRSLRGDWSGIYAAPTSNISFDHVQLSSAGGISLMEGGLARGFLPLELQQATGRITNSHFEANDFGQNGAGPIGRFGRLANTQSTILVRGSQPIIVGNTFVDNRGTIIDIDVESMGGNYRMDIGRQTGEVDRFASLDDNHGPLIRFNRYLDNDFSGLEIRGGTIDQETVFDDTDIAHLVFQPIIVGDLHHSGDLRLLSRPDESLVVKFTGSGNPNSENTGTGLTAVGSPSSTEDRVPGAIHVVGLPGAPVILTSLRDDTVGAGLAPDGSQFTDHNGDGFNSRPGPNDWRGILLDEFSADYNVAVLPELELSTEDAPGLNGNFENAQFLGELAADLLTGDHDRRLGFEVQGFLSGNTDIDTYSFRGTPGTQVWVDIDKTSFNVDTVIELLDENGVVLARSDDSFAETALGTDRVPVSVFDPSFEGVTTSLQAQNEEYTDRGTFDLYEDFGSTNPRDAGIHFRLPGNTSDPNARSVYAFRIRTKSVNPDDAQGGFTGGAYRFQARLTEDQMFAGSVVRYSDIRYANVGIHLRGQMALSPLLGEAQENESSVRAGGVVDNGSVVGANPGSGAQYLGNLVNNRDNVISVGGSLGLGDVDFYEIEVNFANSSDVKSTIFDIDYADGFNRPDTALYVFFDADGRAPFEGPANAPPRLVYAGSASNVADDLTSPNGENSALEKLLRGSVSNGDPLIGPVTLVEGTYYVAVVPEGTEPAFLASSVREPINSIDRIVEDRIDRVNPEPFGTADGPIVPQIFTDTQIAAGSGFGILNDNSAGHGAPSSNLLPTGAAPRFNEALIAAGFDAEDEVGGGVSANLNLLAFSLQDDFEIGGSVFTVPSNTSTTIPHVSIDGNLNNDVADFYQFTLNTPGRVILDIDDGYNALADIDDDFDPATPPINTDLTSVDTTLVLLTPGGGGLLQVATSAGSLVANGGAGSNSNLDPFIDQFLPTGTYFIGVLQDGAVVDLTGGPTAGVIQPGLNDYTLHVSIEDQVVTPPVNGGGAEVLAFSRAGFAPSGTITSEPFDLAGYTAADLPTLYYNQFFDPAGTDSAELVITSDQDLGGVTIPIAQTGWNQERLSLANFAGHTNIRLTFNYQTNGSFSGAVGLRLDDFIVGFAERGESIFGAASGDQFVGLGGGGTGEYQLEVRSGTEFATLSGFRSLTLDESFDTNDRHNQSFTLVAPDSSQISSGDTFVLGDGAANQIFEFTTTGNVTLGNTPVVYQPGDSATTIAGILRNAINNQSVVEIEAASSGGLDNEPTTDARLALHSDAITGTVASVPDARSAAGQPLGRDSAGHLLIPAILHDGVGDSNFIRSQGQVIIEHNTISDSRAIGVWSEPGDRDRVPSLARNNGLLEIPRVGNSYPGAVRNLPTLNDSVLGGLTPGLVIENNTFDRNLFAGVKVEGQNSPWVLEVPFADPLAAFYAGDTLNDGATFTISAGETSVVFEFEDMNDGDDGQNPPGSDIDGGDGTQDARVPVYIRHADDEDNFCYQGQAPIGVNGPQRCFAYEPIEVLHAIRESIQGSILMTNGLIELVELDIGPSLIEQDPNAPTFGFPGLGADNFFPTPALYIHGASGIGENIPGLVSYQAPIYEAPQPFARIVNNTFYGEDGRQSAAVPDLTVEDDGDVFVDATEISIGRSHRNFSADAILGDNVGPACTGCRRRFLQSLFGSW